ncbi:MAG: hypothetical protein J6X24_07585, partial [Firmicutes bacterium]|nr:hypothetical protein [Bacillota bacterium]
ADPPTTSKSVFASDESRSSQEDAVTEVCRQSGCYASFEILRDLAGRVRYLKAFKKVLAT